MYTIEVHFKNGKPIYVVAIKCPLLVGVRFFKTLNEAKADIDNVKANLLMCGDDFTPDFEGYVMDENMYSVIREVIENDDIVIGCNGRTYSKELFPNGI